MASGSGWNLWVWLLGVVVRRYIDILIQLIPTPLVSALILQQHPYFLFIKKNVFHSLVYMLGEKYGFGPSADFAAQTLDRRSAQQIRGSRTQSSDSDHPQILLRKHRIPSRTRPTILRKL